MSDDWVEDRLESAVGHRTAADINDEGFEKWLMVVDESGSVVDVSKLDAKGDALLDANGTTCQTSCSISELKLNG